MENSFKIKEHFNYAPNGALQTIATSTRPVCLLFEDAETLNALSESVEAKYSNSFRMDVLECRFSEIEEEIDYSSAELDHLFKPTIITSTSGSENKEFEDQLKESDVILMSGFGKYNEVFFIEAECQTRRQCGGRKLFSGKRIIMFDYLPNVMRKHNEGRVTKSVFKSQLFYKLNPMIIKVR